MPLSSSLVFSVISTIPYGQVASYGEVARACGFPKGARTVGWILASATDSSCWHRVVNKDGVLTITNTRFSPADQALRLSQESVPLVTTTDCIRVSQPLYRFPEILQPASLENAHQDLRV